MTLTSPNPEQTLRATHAVVKAACRYPIAEEDTLAAFGLMTQALASTPDQPPLPMELMEDHWRIFCPMFATLRVEKNLGTGLVEANLGRLMDRGFDPWRQDDSNRNKDSFASQFLSKPTLHHGGLAFFARLVKSAPDHWQASTVWLSHHLGRAMKAHAFDFADWLLENGADINGVPAVANPPLFSVETKEALAWALDHGADIELRNKEGQQASWAWPTGIQPALLEVLSTHPATKDNPSIRHSLAFDGFVRILAKNKFTVEDYGRTLREQGLKVTTRRDEAGKGGQSLVAASIIAAFDRHNLPWLRNVLGRKIDLGYQSFPGLADAVLASLLVLGSTPSAYGRAKDQLEWIQARIKDEPARKKFLEDEQTGIAALEALLHTPAVNEETIPNLWRPHTGIASQLSQCQWSTRAPWLQEGNAEWGSLGWGLLARVTGSHDQGIFAFDTLKRLSAVLPLEEWPAPSVRAVTAMINTLNQTTAHLLDRSHVAALFATFGQAILGHGVSADSTVLAKVSMDQENRSSRHEPFLVFLQQMKLRAIAASMDDATPAAAPRTVRRL
jgi:hypothetical protein